MKRAALTSIALAGLSVFLAAPIGAQSFPRAEILAARHDSLVGGRAALDSLTSLRLLGTFTIAAAGIEAPVEILKRKPDQYLFRTVLGEMGEVLQGFDGSVAWGMQPGQEPRVITGEERSRIAAQADFYGDLHDWSKLASAETVGETDFVGRRSWEVRMVRTSGDTLYEYFDLATGLSIGGAVDVGTAIGRVRMLTILSDYRAFGPLRIATRIVQRAPEFESVLTIGFVEIDAVRPEDLALPESLRVPDPARAGNPAPTPAPPHSP